MHKSRIVLPNGCSCSKINVMPANWKTVKASTKKPWYISFRFYDQTVSDPKYSKGKFVLLKGMNDVRDLKGRQLVTRELCDTLVRMLHVEGYNPITGRSVPPVEIQAIVDPYTPLLQALRATAKELTCSESVKRDIKSMLGFVATAAGQLGFTELPISHVSRKHIKAILTRIEKNRAPESPYRFNKNRSYFMMLFNELAEYEAIENDPVTKIRKLPIPQKIRQVLNLQERRQVDTYLHEKHYTFWRYLHIFFHSGSRITELMRLRVQDVDLENQMFKVTVIKGNKSKEVLKPIKDLVLSLWTELLADAAKTDFVFAKGLKPGPVAIQSYQITKRWYRLVKNEKKLGITKDFYPLKHLNLDQTAERLSIGDAQAMASHDSPVVTMKFYATGEQGRQLEKLKKLGNEFTG
jgi:site-specific recombinase XerD